MEIIICKTCDGEGEVREDVGTHTSIYEYHTCSKCKGTGRLRTVTYKCTIPLDIPSVEIYETDTKIRNLIRKLESNV